MKKLLKKRTTLIAVILAVLLTVGFAAHMAMAVNPVTVDVSFTVPTMLEITGLADPLTLTLSTVPGTASGNDDFTVNTNAAKGATVSGNCGVFSPSLAAGAPTTTYTGGSSSGPGSFSPNVKVEVAVALADGDADRSASLTVTAAANP